VSLVFISKLESGPGMFQIGLDVLELGRDVLVHVGVRLFPLAIPLRVQVSNTVAHGPGIIVVISIHRVVEITPGTD
jgi:hypothetical protein